MSLANKTLSGFKWTLFEQIGSKGISFIVQIILARLIAPAEFGLLGMILIFIAVGNSLADSGMTQAIIRSEDADEADFSTVFFINLAVSVFLYLLFFAIAPYIAAFYDQPRLTNLIRVYTLSIIINSFYGIQRTRLVKSLNFKDQMVVQLPAVIIGGIVGLVFAFLNFGVWALVYMEIAVGIMLALLYFSKTKWIPSLIIDKKKLISHFKFGYKLTISGLLSRITGNIFPLIIGKFFSTATVGFYTRALTMKEFPINIISNSLDKVLYPIFSRIQNDDLRLKAAYKRVQMISVFTLSTLMLLLIIVAEPLFNVLFGSVWLPAVPYFQLLCISGIFYPLIKYNANVLKVKGRSDLYLQASVSINIIQLVGVAATVQFGVMALVLSQVVTSFISVLIYIYFANKFIGYSLWDQFVDLLPILLPATIAFAFVFGSFNLMDGISQLNDVFQIIALSMAFLVLILGFAYYFNKTLKTEMLGVLKMVKRN